MRTEALPMSILKMKKPQIDCIDGLKLHQNKWKHSLIEFLWKATSQITLEAKVKVSISIKKILNKCSVKKKIHSEIVGGKSNMTQNFKKRLHAY